MFRWSIDWILPVALMWAVAFRLSGWAGESEKPPVKANQAPVAMAEFHGRVVCLPEEMHRLHETELPTGHEHILGFKTQDGTYYTLLRVKMSEALFADARLRERDLVLRGRILPKTQILEPVRIFSIKNSILHDVYYYCEVCSIQTVAPGPCPCCQDAVELVEEPLPNGPPAKSAK